MKEAHTIGRCGVRVWPNVSDHVLAPSVASRTFRVHRKCLRPEVVLCSGAGVVMWRTRRYCHTAATDLA